MEKFEDFPEFVLPQIAENAVNSVAGMVCAHRALYAPAALAVAGYIGCKRLYLNVKKRPITPANFYIVGAPSSAGKNACRWLWKPMIDWQIKRAVEYAEDIRPGLRADLQQLESQKKAMTKDGTKLSAELGEKLKEIESDIREAKIGIEKKQRILAKDFSSAVLYKILQDSDGKIAIFSEEARTLIDRFLGLKTEAGQLNEDLLLSLHTGESIDVSRLGYDEDIYTVEARASMFLGVQTDKAQEFFDNEKAAASGLQSRTLTCIVPKRSKRWDDFDCADTQGLEHWNVWVTEMLKFYEKAAPKTINLTPGANAVFGQYFDEIEASDDLGKLVGYEDLSGRWSEHAWRIALAMHLIEHGRKAGDIDLEEQTAKNAIGVMRWYVRQLFVLIGNKAGAQKKSRNDRLLKALGSRQDGMDVRTMLSQKIFKDVRDASNALEPLRALGTVARVPSETKSGKPTTVWMLPKYAKAKATAALREAA